VEGGGKGFWKLAIAKARKKCTGNVFFLSSSF